jgi:endonuclease G, mitochondrial
MAKSNVKSSRSAVEAAPGTTVPADLLLELLRESAGRTERALAPEATSGFESISTTSMAGIEPPGAEASSAQRLRSNPPDAVERRLRRRGLPEESARSLARESDRAQSGFESLGVPDEQPGLERIIGRNMLMEVNYLEAGQQAGRSVGRVLIRDSRNRSLGFGTGFLVAPRLLLTNNHVLSSPEIAGVSQVEFNYQRGLDGRMGQTTVFNIDKDSFFVTSPVKELDFTLVAIEDSSADGHRLDEFGYLPLTAVADEVLAGECVTIIQHPKGDPKQVALRKNEVIKLPDDQDRFLHYQTDTNPGSSGSPVFNDGWEVVALHHSGKPAVDAKGNYLTDDGSSWTPDMGLDRIKWVANEGVRVAAIVKFLQTRELTEAQKALLAPALTAAPRTNGPPIRADEVRPDSGPSAVTSRQGARIGTTPKVAVGPDVLLRDPTPSPSPVIMPATSPTIRQVALAPESSVSITIPLELTVRLLAPTSGSIAGRPGAATTDEEAIQIDPDYGTREGYDPEFLGLRDLAVPMPRLTRAQEANAAVNRLARTGESSYELPYHHFSVVLNRKRRLAYFTAVNIDGRTPGRSKREADRWFFDPRIDPGDQVGNDFYKGTQFDRGHLVRRLDPAWGRSPTVAKAANDDTFHFTNCSPQHERFNEGKNLWAGLEDYLLNRAGDERLRLTVFTGPVFTKSDPEYRGLPIPKQFWKVAVTTRAGGGLSATAYVVSQEDLIRPLFEAAAVEMAAAEVARLFQVRVRKVEELTGLDFGRLRDFDPTGGLEVFESTEQGERELEDYDEIVLDEGAGT